MVHFSNHMAYGQIHNVRKGLKKLSYANLLDSLLFNKILKQDQIQKNIALIPIGLKYQ